MKHPLARTLTAIALPLTLALTACGTTTSATGPGGNKSTTPGASPVLGVWLETAATASAGSCIACPYKYDWNDLTLKPDGTFTWENTYTTGTYQTFPAANGNTNVVLSSGSHKCQVTYSQAEDTLYILVENCRGLFVDGAELNQGSILFRRRLT